MLDRRGRLLAPSTSGRRREQRRGRSWALPLAGAITYVVCIPLDSWSWEVKGLDVGKVEGPIPRSGVDPVGRSTTRSTSVGSSMG